MRSSSYFKEEKKTGRERKPSSSEMGKSDKAECVLDRSRSRSRCIAGTKGKEGESKRSLAMLGRMVSECTCVCVAQK